MATPTWRGPTTHQWRSTHLALRCPAPYPINQPHQRRYYATAATASRCCVMPWPARPRVPAVILPASDPSTLAAAPPRARGRPPLTCTVYRDDRGRGTVGCSVAPAWIDPVMSASRSVFRSPTSSFRFPRRREPWIWASGVDVVGMPGSRAELLGEIWTRLMRCILWKEY
jgi:hypothetical protein